MGRRNEAFIHDLIESSDQLVEACRGKGALIEQAAMNKQFSNYCRLILQPSELEDKHPEQYQRIVDTLKRDRLSVLFDGRARKRIDSRRSHSLGALQDLRLLLNFVGNN